MMTEVEQINQLERILGLDVSDPALQKLGLNIVTEGASGVIDAVARDKAKQAAAAAAEEAKKEKDPYGPLHMKANQLAMAAGLPPSMPMMPQKPPSSSQNFLTKMAGPLPVWGWGAVGVAGISLAVIVAKLAGGRKR
jgi:hypothetical protein